MISHILKLGFACSDFSTLMFYRLFKDTVGQMDKNKSVWKMLRKNSLLKCKIFSGSESVKPRQVSSTRKYLVTDNCRDNDVADVVHHGLRQYGEPQERLFLCGNNCIIRRQYLY